ncbi:hypothetical protein ATE84_2760 [Aquimarina sp. MAR_2010_214]|uniref:DUF7660 family protein n=1 Tax=Aquimarina sp. MAR_2010_214 TaxID=1250026 RepID=UPI000CC32AF5|nr:hypothetical protein [Aquimarina sp. MAR_2010_214]PKV50694.1 hypothetical protein ATE84_2760 [Aquimarina sp. MAR_2010_214]
MHEEIIKIKNKQDFLSFLNMFIKDFKNNKDSWGNSTVDTFLEGMESWIDDMEGYYINMNLPVPENIDWKVFADILYASKMYE